MPKITINTLDPASIADAIGQLDRYRDSLQEKADELAHELAQVGYDVAVSIMWDHVYSGATIDSLEVVKVEDGKYVLRAASEALLFFEFGAGARYGAGHPWDGQLGMGPGTYPGQTHAFDYYGWWYPSSDPAYIVYTDKNGQGWAHSYGQKPHKPFFEADREIRERILDVARRVFDD